jgi:NADH dehydrogenase (ubiquinone) Fe-S protein 1
MCLVEVEGAPKPIASCATNVRPDLKVFTKTERTRIARGGVMEFLLANHPLDCPICDQGGECDLQDISSVYGYTEGRFMEYKRAVEDKQLGPLIKTAMTRCIHCTRCVRFTELIAGQYSLGQVMRGKQNEISTYVESVIDNELSGNVVDLCPVGALNNLPYSFQARPWELKSNYSIDVMDGMGANIDAQTRGADLLRVLPRINEEVNEEWISDKSRHAFDGLKKQRLSVPMSRKDDGSFKELNWQEAMQTAAAKLSSVSGDEVQGVIGQFQDLESIVAFKDLLNRLNSDHIDVRSNAPNLDVDFRSQYLMNSQIVGIDETDLLLLIGTNPKTECPVLNARIRKAVSVNGLDVAVIGPGNNLTYNYTHVGNSAKTLQELADGTHPFSERFAKAEFPMIITGSDTLSRSDGKAITNLINSLAEKNPNLINEAEAWNGVNVLHSEASKVGALDLGIQSKQATEKAKVVFLLGADNFRHEDIPEDAFVIYMGTTGDEGVYYADLILPTSSYLEKQGTYVNMDGRVQ